MNGRVDHSGRALITLPVRQTAQSSPTTIEAWIDTGFTGELVLPQSLISTLGLTQSGTVNAVLGDGSKAAMNYFTCLIDWFGQTKQIEVIANAGQYPLLGVGLLHDHRLTVDYRSKSVTIS